MNRIKRNIAIAGVAGATILGGLGLTSSISAAQTDSGSSSSSSAPAAPGNDSNAQNPDRPADCNRGPEGRHGANLDVAAKAIGVSTDDLRTALQNGSTLAQVAQQHGVEPQTVIDALVADVQSHLADKVSSGEITQAQADQHLADATQHITDFVNNGKPDRPDGAQMPQGGQDAPADAPAGS